MQCYTELIPPSGVTSALALPFTSPDASNLVIARTSRLQIFSHKQTGDGQDTKLVLVAEYTLSGTITSLGRVKILNSKSGGEAILIALREAKLSLIEWDPEKHSIATISIHYYESETLPQSPFVPDLHDCVSHLTVDPSSRCAVFNFGLTNLAIIPFHQVGDDLIMDDYDAEFDQEDAERSPTKITNGHAGAYQTPYASSFVLPLTALDPGILHPVHLAFLHEYREPTFGVIYSSIARSSALNYERRDVTHYAVFTLDLEQRASTTLLSISKLPNDLFAVIPLPLPVGGALLVGANELIHVDQGGRTSAVGVNEFSRQSSSFAMADQSESRLRLEGCQIEQLNPSNGDMLIVLATGHLAVLNFRLDGRTVSGMSIRILPRDLGQTIFRSRASCIASLGSNRLFLGSDVADSVLLGTARKSSQMKKHGSKSKVHLVDEGKVENAKAEEHDEEEKEEEEEDDDDDDVDDDLYGDALDKSMTGQSEGLTTSGTNIRVLDRLHCVAPLRDITIGRAGKRKREDDDLGEQERSAKLDLVACCGEGLAGGVSIFNRELRHEIVNKTKLSRADGVWSFSVKPSAAAADGLGMDRSYDEFMIVSRSNNAGQAESVLYQVSDLVCHEKTDTDFDSSAGGTIECGSITNGAHVVQVLEAEVRVYGRGKPCLSSRKVCC
jgi:cleavage and polyadenylation specificity factor subunit 1